MAIKIFQKNVLLKNYTTYKIGGPAKYFFIAKNKEDLIKAIRTAKELKLPIFILGGGSNVLVSDKGFPGLAIKMQNVNIKVQNENACLRRQAKYKIINAEAGVLLSKLVSFAAENNLTDFEWASGVPGTVGGAVYGNAQAFGSRISDLVKSVEVLDIKKPFGPLRSLRASQCQFFLKNSIFKKEKNLIIVSVALKFKKGDKAQIKKKINEYSDYRKKNHPMNCPSAGSVFVNPEIKGKIIPAGYLIEKAGLKGKKIGDAQISEKHANFIINLRKAKAKDVLALIKLAKKKVNKIFGENLEIEVQFIGFKK